VPRCRGIVDTETKHVYYLLLLFLIFALGCGQIKPKNDKMSWND